MKNKDSLDISVIIPTFNRAESLSGLLDSLLEANVPDGVRHEIIVVDNNSTDETRSLVEGLAGKRPEIVYCFEEVKGVSCARNRGIRESRGDILLFADHDVVVDKNWIEAYWKFFGQTDALAAQGKILLERDPGELPPWLKLEGKPLLPRFDPGENVTFSEFLIGCNMAFRKEVFEQYGWFHPRLGAGSEAGFGEDTDFAKRLQACGLRINYVPDALVFHELDKTRAEKEYWQRRIYKHGYTLATTDYLVEWKRPNPLRSMRKLGKYYLKYALAGMVGDKHRLLKYDRKIRLRRGMLDGTLEAMRERRRICRNEQKLSACVITQNNEHCIGRAIKSLEGFCDEIIVVDGGSQDNTAEIAKSFATVKYYLKPWNGNYIEQKNWAINKATGDWVLSLDSDEVVGANMRRKIRKLMKSNRHSSYMFPRYWLISESSPLYIRARKLYPDYQQRLFRNIPKYRYTQNRLVHHLFPKGVQGNAKKAKDTHIFHFDFIYRNREEREEKVKRRAEIEPETAHINRNQYLYEDHPYKIRKCRERLW